MKSPPDRGSGSASLGCSEVITSVLKPSPQKQGIVGAGGGTG
jgi:hypothetical protein